MLESTVFSWYCPAIILKDMRSIYIPDHRWHYKRKLLQNYMNLLLELLIIRQVSQYVFGKVLIFKILVCKLVNKDRIIF